MEGLGFGCVRLTSNYTKKQALRNLEVAFDNGISHFDVAPLYGFGLAEGFLGDFAKDKRDKITITTKFGIEPRHSVLKNLVVQNIVRSLYKAVKGAKMQSAANSLSATTKTATNFSVAAAEQSLHHSLRELKSDRIDFFLLHEALVSEANNGELLHFLNTKKQEGKIKNFGIASFANSICSDISALNSVHNVLQTNNSFPFSLPVQLQDATGLTQKFYFSPFLHLAEVSRLFDTNSEFAKSLSALLDFDVRKNISDLFLMHQLLSDAKGTTLFTSAKNEKIVGAIHSWKRVQAMTPTQLQNFPLVQQQISKRLMLARA